MKREEVILVGPCAEEANCVEKNMFFIILVPSWSEDEGSYCGRALECRRGDVLRLSLRGTYMFKTALGRTWVEEGGK